MILTGLACFFAFLFIYDLLRPEKSLRDYKAFDIGYLLVVGGLAYLCAKPALNVWQLERSLSRHAAIFADRPNATVSCTSVLGSIFDQYDMTRAGSAYIEEAKIIFHYGWCQHFMEYLADPVYVNDDELLAMHIFTHEVMHIRGEYNEQKTDCQAIQRNHLLGEQMGIDPFVAKQNALLYYNSLYSRHPYYNPSCAPNTELDEKLSNSIWD